ncbi:MAG TPA: ABC transporter permease subunit, partial [Kiritimatiellia bacterium]|nr:ABC transporter permease subunit [Kiritimatiellia bacterium]
HPVTRRRWARFRGMRRAWWAFWFLLGAYGISLFSEWIANDKPLWVRFEGRNYFPVLRFYPEDAFTGNGRMTRPDYRALAAGEAFAPGSGNRMRWPLIPYGPLESLSPEHIELPDTVSVAAVRESRVASADLDAGGQIVRTAGDAGFFGLSAGAFPSVAGGNAADVGAPATPSGGARGAEWPEEFRAGLAERRANRAAGPVDARVRLTDGRLVWVSLSPFEPRPSPPSHVRVTFREDLEAPERIRAVVAETDPVYPDGFPVPGTPGWLFTTSREQVSFPFRPVKGHPLGLDSSGRDVAARMLYALRTSLTFGMALVLATMTLGTLAGALQGYYGGGVDLLGQRVIEIWESLPFIYVLILLGSVYGQSFLLLLGVYAVFNWIGISYYMRGEFLRLRKLPFVESARVIGLPTRKILFRHMLPNALVPLVTFFPFSLVGAIGVMAALDYLGFGLPPPTPSWGELLAQAQEFPHAWWLVLYPSLALFFTMLAGVFVGEGLRAAFDPRTFGR